MISAFGIAHGPDDIAKAIPSHGYVKGKGVVQVLHQHSKDHFMVLTDRDERVLVHRKRITFTKPPKGRGISKADIKAPPSQEELRHRKKVSANLSMASSTMGIAGLASLAAGKLVPVGARKIPKLFPKSLATKKGQKKFGHKANKAALGFSSTAGGIGGVGGFNYAKLQREEARKKRI